MRNWKGSICALILVMLAINVKAQKLKNASDSLAYALGVMTAQDLSSKEMSDVDLKMMMEGIKDGIAKKEGPIDARMARQVIKEEKVKRTKVANEMRKKEGAAFLEKKKAESNVFELEKGVLYEVITAGDGPKPAKGGDVKIHYTGMLIDGTVFDSSYDRGQPNTFNLARLVKGWQIALPEMTVGSKWRIYLPSDVAYGSRSAGALIKPHSTLIFDIELLGI